MSTESSRPRIILSAAMSVDGKIATVSGDSALSSEEDRARVHRLRSRVDAILVGKNTVLRDDPLLTVRLARGRNPTRIVLDSSGSIPPDCRILRTCGTVPTMVAVSKRIPKGRLARLRGLPVEVVTAGERSVNLKTLMKILAKKNIRTVLVEGGGTVNWAFVRAGLFDEMYIAISPRVLGGAGAVSLVQGSGFGTVKKSARLRLDSASRLGGCLVLHYTKL